MPRGLSPDAVVDVAKGRGLSVNEQNRERFIRYRDISDGEVSFVAPIPSPINVVLQGRLAPITFGFLESISSASRQSVTLSSPTVNNIHSLIKGPGNYLFASTRSYPANFVCWPDYNDLSTYSVLQFNSTDPDAPEDQADSMQYDPVTDACYVCCHQYMRTSDGTNRFRILKVDYRAMTYSVLVDFNSTVPAGAPAMECDGSFLYVITGEEATSAKMLKFDISTGTNVATRAITGRKAGHTITKDANFLYCGGPTSGTNNGAPWAARVPKDLSTQISIQLDPKPSHLITDDSCLLNGFYYCAAEVPGRGIIKKVASDMSSYTDIYVGVDADSYGVLTDGTYLYALMATDPGCLVQFDQTGFIYQVWTGVSGEHAFNELQFAPGCMLITTWWAPANVIAQPMGTRSMPSFFFPPTAVAAQFTASALASAALQPQSPGSSSTYSMVITAAVAPQSSASLTTFSAITTLAESAKPPAALATFSSICTAAVAPQSSASLTTFNTGATKVEIRPAPPSASVTYSAVATGAWAANPPAALTTYDVGSGVTYVVAGAALVMRCDATFSAVATGAMAAVPPSGNVTYSSLTKAATAPQGIPATVTFSAVGNAGPTALPAPAALVTFSGISTGAWAANPPSGNVTYSNPSSPAFAPTGKGTATFSSLTGAVMAPQSPGGTVTYSSVSTGSEALTSPPGSFTASNPSAPAFTPTGRGTVTFSVGAISGAETAVPGSMTVTFSIGSVSGGSGAFVQGPSARFDANAGPGITVPMALFVPSGNVTFSTVITLTQTTAAVVGTVTFSSLSRAARAVQSPASTVTFSGRPTTFNFIIAAVGTFTASAPAGIFIFYVTSVRHYPKQILRVGKDHTEIVGANDEATFLLGVDDDTTILLRVEG